MQTNILNEMQLLGPQIILKTEHCSLVVFVVFYRTSRLPSSMDVMRLTGKPVSQNVADTVAYFVCCELQIIYTTTLVDSPNSGPSILASIVTGVKAGKQPELFPMIPVRIS